MTLYGKFSQKFQKMSSHILAERFKIHINAIHSHILGCLDQLTDNILSRRSAGKCFSCAYFLCKVIDQTPYLKPLFMSL